MDNNYSQWTLDDLCLEIAKRKLAHGITEESFPDPEQRRVRLAHRLRRDDELLQRYPGMSKYPDFGRDTIMILIAVVWFVLYSIPISPPAMAQSTVAPIVFGPSTSIAITDGDTLKIGDIRVRLHGIDAPEKAQTCEIAPKVPDTKSTTYPCGFEATNTLRSIIGSQSIFCAVLDVDYFGRLIARCHLGSPYGIDISRSMVELGWAIAYRQYSKDYIADEDRARTNNFGIWRGPFQNPAAWRKEQSAKEK